MDQLLKFAVIKTFLGVLLFAATAFSAADPHCVDSTKTCFYPVGTVKFPTLWVVPEGSLNSSANAIKGAEFYAYFPNDTLIINPCTDAGVCNKDSVLQSPVAVTASDSTGLVYLRARSVYPVTSAPMGTMTDAEANPTVFRYYTFYLPELQFFYLQGSDTVFVDESTLLSLPVDSSLTVYVEAVVPEGPLAGKKDSLITKTFYFSTPTGSDKLQFYTLGGDTTSRVDVEKGIGSFVIKASSAVSGATFALGGFPDPANTSSFMVNETFPGKLNFENPDLPSLDSAFIYDADGDGVGDSIIAYFSGKTDSVTWDSIFYSWPNGESFKQYTGDYARSSEGDVMQLLDVKTSALEDSGEGDLKVYVTSSLSSATSALTSDIEDRIGPVIEKATLIAGVNGAKDTLVIAFNKDIDTSLTSGKIFELSNGNKIYVKAISKDGDTWTFVADSGAVSVGDSLSIVVGLGDSGVVTADGNEPSFNLPAVVTNSGRVYLSNENNGFYDSDADGRMDSVTVGFENAITEEDLENLDLHFYWLDSTGNVLDIVPDAKDLVLSEDGTIVSYVLSDKWESQVKENLTSINSEDYGYAALVGISVINGDTAKAEVQYLEMNDRMAPVISSTFLSPESEDSELPDRLVVTFSESIDTTAIAEANFIGFVIDGDTTFFDFSYVVWNDDLTKLTLFLADDEDLLSRANPNDSLFILSSAISDTSGNKVASNSQLVEIEGDPRVVMETSSFIGLDRVALASDGASFTERFFPAGTSVKNEMGKSLGVMLDIAFATIFDDSTGESLDLSKVGLDWEMFVYTNLGAYVSSSHGEIKCNDADFGGNCFENPKRLYLRWNLRAENGRKAGIGVYIAKFRLKVHGEKDSYKFDKIFKWGVHGGKGGLALDD